MATEATIAWLKGQRRKSCVGLLVLAALGFVIGFAFFCLAFFFFSFVSLLFAPVAMALGRRFAIFCPLSLATVAMVLLMLDSARSRRDDLSNLGLWLLRESLGLGPRILLESYRCARRALGWAHLDVGACARVLLFLASRKKSVSRDELRQAFPGQAWEQLAAQLRLIDGVVFLKADLSRMTLSAPLRLRLRHWLDLERPAEKATQAPPEPEPITEPEKLSPYELLGVSPNAGLAEIKAAYRARVKECHPDRFPGLDQAARELAEEWTKALNAAYAELMARRAGRGG